MKGEIPDVANEISAGDDNAVRFDGILCGVFMNNSADQKSIHFKASKRKIFFRL